MTCQRLFRGADLSSLGPGVTAEQALRLFSWTLDGRGKQYATILKQWPLDLASVQSLMFAEVDTHVALLRHGIEADSTRPLFSG